MYYVAVQKGESRNALLTKTLQEMESRIPDVNGKIMIKPNFLSSRTGSIASTTPETLEIVMQFFREKFPNNEICVAEGSHVSAEYLEKYQIKQRAEKYGVQVFSIDYDENDWKIIEFEDLLGKRIPVRISNTYAKAGYIVSLTVPKTHANIGVSLSMKNLVGIIHPDDRPKFHGLSENVPPEMKDKYKSQVYDRDDKIGFYAMKLRSALPVSNKTAVDLKRGGETVRKNLYNLYKNIRPDFCIIDGFDGMQGNGPWNGDNAKLRTVIVGDNPVATDLVACKIMGQPLKDIGYTNYIEDILTYPDNTKVIGNTIDEVKKNLKPHKFEPYL